MDAAWAALAAARGRNALPGRRSIPIEGYWFRDLAEAES